MKIANPPAHTEVSEEKPDDGQTSGAVTEWFKVQDLGSCLSWRGFESRRRHFLHVSFVFCFLFLFIA